METSTEELDADGPLEEHDAGGQWQKPPLSTTKEHGSLFTTPLAETCEETCHPDVVEVLQRQVQQLQVSLQEMEGQIRRISESKYNEALDDLRNRLSTLEQFHYCFTPHPKHERPATPIGTQQSGLTEVSLNTSERSDWLSERVERTAGHTIEQSAWEVFVFVGVRELGVCGSIMVIISVLINILVQGVFAMVCMGGLAGTEFNAGAVESATRWRLTAAHDAGYADNIGWRSLVTRVCDHDDSLVVSSSQVQLLKGMLAYRSSVASVLDTMISYIKGQDANADSNKTPVPVSEFSVGELLTFATLVMWFLVVCKEFHNILHYTRGLMNLATGRTKITLRDDTFEIVSMSRSRKLFCMSAVIVRTLVAFLLLVSGLRWLANTSQIENLILNAAALAFIMDTDEIIYDTLVPRMTKAFVEHLKMLEVPADYRRFGLGPIPVLTLVSCLGCSIYHYYNFTRVMVKYMDDVDHELCAWNKDFIITDNYGVGLHVVGRTRTEQMVGKTSIMDVVSHYKEIDFRGTQYGDPLGPPDSNTIAWFENSRTDFMRARFSSRHEVSPPYCIDLIKPSSGFFFHDFFNIDWFRGSAMRHMLRTLFAMPEANTCADFAPFCNNNTANSDLLRFACSQTCACSTPKALAHRKGCQKACDSIMQVSMQELDCEDPSPASLIQDQRYIEFLENLNYAVFPRPDNFTSLRTLGCQTFEGDTLGYVWHGFSGLHKPMFCGSSPAATTPGVTSVSFRTFCPRACGCVDESTWECPEACTPKSTRSSEVCSGLCGSLKLRGHVDLTLVLGEDGPWNGVTCADADLAYHIGLFSGSRCEEMRVYFAPFCCAGYCDSLEDEIREESFCPPLEYCVSHNASTIDASMMETCAVVAALGLVEL